MPAAADKTDREGITKMEQTGRLTLPTDADVVEETLRLKNLLGADALRDCDGTEMPQELLTDPAKKYATYYTTRKDNAWAEANPDEIQQEYLISDRHTARGTTLRIHLMDGFHTQQLKVNTLDDPKRWWEVIDRTTGEVVPTDKWFFDEPTGEVEIETIPYHEYTVSFLAFLIWDPVHMYNFLTNDWKDTPHQLTYDVRQPKTQAYVKEKLRRWCEANPHIDVVRFTTFFHQFTLTFDDQKREKFVEWFGYSASVSPYILEKFEKWAGYKFRPEFIVDQGYHNTMFRVPSKEFRDFIEFQQQEVCALAKEMVDIVHSYGKEAMMFLGDHWIGTEPYGKYFASIGLDAVVGSVGSGVTLRMISDIKGVKYTEGRLLPYFFPDVFTEGGDPIGEARTNWMKARRAILRSPLDRIGYGGYLKLASNWPGFIDEIQNVVGEFRQIHENMQGTKSYVAPFKVAILNCWGGLRKWMSNQVHHSIYHRETYSAEGVLDVAVGVFEHVHELDVPGVGHGLAAPALAFLRGLIDAAVLRAEGGGRLLAGEGVRDAGAVAPCAVLREQHARAERTVWEHGTGHGHEAVVLDAAVAEGHVLGVELQAVEARGGHDERVAVRAVGGPCSGLVLDGRDERLAGVVDASVDVPHAESRERAVVVAAAHGVGGRDDGQSGVVVEFHALRAVGRGPEREPDGIDVRVRVGREVFREIGYAPRRRVVFEICAVLGLLRAFQPDVIAQTDHFVCIHHLRSFLLRR